MNSKQYYKWENEKFSKLYEPVRAVMGAYGNAEKWFADIKDRVLTEFGMPFLSNYIHSLEHKQPIRIDAFAEVVHIYGLRLPYPETRELGESLDYDIGRVFDVSIQIIDEIDEALNEFIRASAGNEFNAISLKAEELQLLNASDRQPIIEAWKMWDNGDMNRATFDNWCRNHFNESGET